MQPSFPENCMKTGPGASPKFYYVDPPLFSFPSCNLRTILGRNKSVHSLNDPRGLTYV